MDLNEYQQRAMNTDKVKADTLDTFIVPLLGLAGETGSLLTQYKKYLRDGNSYYIFEDRLAEELGDILWYVANISKKFNLSLSDVADRNLKKVESRWLPKESPRQMLFDEHFPSAEQLPRKFEAEIIEKIEGGKRKMILKIDGEQVGDPLTDNAPDDDGYRFHDVFHLAYAAVLGWSPVIRKNLKAKRKSNPEVDEIQDGGRAAVIEEGISALVFAYAKDHAFFEEINTIDWGPLRTIADMVAHLEVSRRSLHDWESAILQGYSVWRQVRLNGGGVVACDLNRRTIQYQKKKPGKISAEKKRAGHAS